MPKESPLSNTEKPKEGKILPNAAEAKALRDQEIQYQVVRNEEGIIGQFVNTKTKEVLALINDATHSIDFTFKGRKDGSVLIDVFDKSPRGRIPAPPRLMAIDGQITQPSGIDSMGPGTRYAIIAKLKK